MRAQFYIYLLTAVACAGAASGVRAEEVVEKRVALSFSNATNLDTGDGHLRLRYEYVQDDARLLAMEAERAWAIRFTPDRGVMGRDPDASGGLYTAYVDHLEFRFELKAAGKYTAWYRGYFPWAGNWCHSENVDGGETHILTDSTGETLNKWIWTKGPAYDLAPGKHSWNFTPAGWCGGARLDKIVLVKEAGYTPTGPGAESARSMAPTTGEIFTEEVSRKTLVRWGALKVEDASQQGSVAIDYSTDEGGTWNPLPPGGNLSKVPSDQGIVFKLSLSADPGGMSPFLTRADLTYVMKKVPEIVLENDKAQLRFSGENGALLGLRNKATRTEYVIPEMEAPLFSFMALRGEYGSLREIGFTQAELKKVTGPARGELSFAYELMGGGLLVNLKVRLEERGLVRFSMEVTNKTMYNIAQVKFPMLKGLCIGNDPGTNFLCTPILTGGIAKNPASLKFPRLVFTDRPLYYPGVATMCWMDLWGPKGGGLYLACEDKDYRITELTFSSGSGEGQGAAQNNTAPLPPTEGGYIPAATPGKCVNLGFNKHMLLTRSNVPVRIPEVVLGIHEGDWHWGADRYREWAESWMKKTEVPEWFRDSEGWTDIHLIHLGSFVDIPKGRPKVRRIMTMQNPPFPLFTCWAQQTSCEAYWSTPVLHRLLGNEEEFAGGIQKQHEMGHRMTFYVLPPRINPIFTPEGKRFGCVPRTMIPEDEIPPVGFYPEVAQRNLDGGLVDADGIYSEAGCCMGATRWRDYLDHIVLDKYVKQYGADGMYLDGIGLVTYDCANLNHGHRGYGEWSQALDQWLERVKREARKVRPGAIFSGEGMNDVDHRYLDVGLFYMDNAPQVYRYTFPHNLGVVHGAPVTHYKEFPMDAGWFEFATVLGLKFGGTDYMFEIQPEKGGAVLNFRKQFSQFQSRARFVDEVGLHLSDPDLRAKLYLREEQGTRGALVVVYNGKQKEGVSATVDAVRVGALKSAWCFTLEGMPQRLEVRRARGQYQFTLPPSRMSAMLLIEKSEPSIDLENVAPVVPGESGKVRMTVRNLEDRPVAGKLSLGLPPGWKGGQLSFKVSSGESAAFELGFEVPSTAKYDVHDLYAVTKVGNRETKKCIPIGVCRPVQAEIYYLKSDTVRVQLQNASDREITGTGNLVTPESVTVEGKDLPFRIPPKGKAELIFRMGNVGSIKTREHIKAILRYGSMDTMAYELLQPPLLNGGFEQSTAGDGFPDYWNYRGPESMYLTGIVLDRNTFVEGTQSLRIDPYEAEVTNHLATTLIKLVPNTRYRLSCSIKRSADVPGVGIRFFSMHARGNDNSVEISLGGKTSVPPGAWEKFEAQFTTPEIDVPYEMVVCNSTKGAATVWYDDLRIEEVK